MHRNMTSILLHTHAYMHAPIQTAKFSWEEEALNSLVFCPQDGDLGFFLKTFWYVIQAK